MCNKTFEIANGCGVLILLMGCDVGLFEMEVEYAWLRDVWSRKIMTGFVFYDEGDKAT